MVRSWCPPDHPVHWTLDTASVQCLVWGDFHKKADLCKLLGGDLCLRLEFRGMGPALRMAGTLFMLASRGLVMVAPGVFSFPSRRILCTSCDLALPLVLSIGKDSP